MKKLLILLLITMFLAWCSIQTNKLFDFDKYNYSLNNQIDQILSKYFNLFYSTWILNNYIDLNIKWKNPDSDINLDIKLTTYLDSYTQNYTTKTDYKLDLYSKSNLEKIKSTWSFFYKNIEYTPFFYLENFDINLWTGNVEADFINTISSLIKNKRILIDIQNSQNILQKRVDISNFLLEIYNINKCNAIFATNKTIHDTRLTYKVWLNYTKLQKCEYLNKDYYSWIVFEWFLRWMSDKRPNLEIKEIKLPNNDNIIKWNISYNKIFLEIIDQNNDLIKINININKEKTRLQIDYKNIKTDINLREKKESIDIYWNIVVLINNKKLLFDLQWNLSKQTTSKFDLTQPINYIILSQLLWDSFSLQNILWDKTSF